MGKSKKRRCNVKKSTWSSFSPKKASKSKKPEVATVYSTKFEAWRSHTEKAYCPICKKAIVPLVLEKRRRVTSSGFAAICLLGCWPLCSLFPLKGDTSVIVMRCPVCGHEYGTLDPRVKEISASKGASSVSTLSNATDVSQRQPLNTQIKTHSRTAMKSREKEVAKNLFADGAERLMENKAMCSEKKIDSCSCGIESYQLVEQYKYYHEQQPVNERCFSQHKSRLESHPVDRHEKSQLPRVAMSHEGESTFHSIQNTYRDDDEELVRGGSGSESIVYNNKNCREFTCNEDEAYNHSDWTEDDCRIQWDGCCQGRFQIDAN